MGNSVTITRIHRRSVQFAGSAIAGALIFAPVAQAADVVPCPEKGCNGVTALLVGGQGSYATLTEQQMETAFGGYFRPYDQRVSVPFPGDADFSKSIPEGATNLYNAVVDAKTADPNIVLTIGGVSKGAPSVIEALRQLEVTREAGGKVPDADHMNVMIYGAPSRIYYAGVKYRPDIPVTPYDVYMVSAEYDGVADMPDNMLNILAVLNAMQGADLLHVDAAFNTDFVNDPMLYKVDTNADGGKTTTIVIPYTGDILPLLHPMLEAGADPAQLAKLSTMLKPIIDSAYKRNSYFEKKKWQTGIVSIPLPEAAPSNVVNQTLKVSVPADDSQDAVSPPVRKTLSDYVGKHRAADADDDSADTTKVKKNVLKDLGDTIKTEVKKLTTKKDKKATKEAAPEKKETAGAASSSDSGSNSTGSES
ncbi:PE-PPE domain protein [Mycolicibacterium obuense]|uniref:PE-PPE domain protein n=1 Tax=Mycolicibacterium obuense TaxID=1807 RepID=A0A0J6YLT7_9MYCO|nr:PE-PPE domain protein [Mycolicibacterium obuense]